MVSIISFICCICRHGYRTIVVEFSNSDFASRRNSASGIMYWYKIKRSLIKLHQKYNTISPSWIHYLSDEATSEELTCRFNNLFIETSTYVNLRVYSILELVFWQGCGNHLMKLECWRVRKEKRGKKSKRERFSVINKLAIISKIADN